MSETKIKKEVEKYFGISKSNFSGIFNRAK